MNRCKNNAGNNHCKYIDIAYHYNCKSYIFPADVLHADLQIQTFRLPLPQTALQKKYRPQYIYISQPPSVPQYG